MKGETTDRTKNRKAFEAVIYGKQNEAGERWTRALFLYFPKHFGLFDILIMCVNHPEKI